MGCNILPNNSATSLTNDNIPTRPRALKILSKVNESLINDPNHSKISVGNASEICEKISRMNDANVGPNSPDDSTNISRKPLKAAANPSINGLKMVDTSPSYVPVIAAFKLSKVAITPSINVVTKPFVDASSLNSVIHSKTNPTTELIFSDNVSM